MRRGRPLRADGTLHGMVMVKSRRLLRNLAGSLSLSGRAIDTALLCRRKDGARPTGIFWIVQETANVMYEQRVEEFGDLFLVGEIESPLEGDPISISPVRCRPGGAVTHQTPLRCIGPIFTT
jgi:hypothetical protein